MSHGLPGGRQVLVRIAGCGGYVPSGELTNEDLARRFGVTPEWIESRTGIVTRRVAAPGEAASDLAVPAARAALTSACVRPEALDIIIVATSTPDTLVPPTACRVQRALGARRCPAVDVAASCAGFLYALQYARAHLATGSGRTALVVAAEVRTRFVDPYDRDTATLYGDGAGAVVLVVEDSCTCGIIDIELGADGVGVETLSTPPGGSAAPASPQTLAGRLHYVRMDGRRMARAALRLLVDAVRGTLSRHRLTASDVDLMVPHQMNGRLISALARRIGLSERACYFNLRGTGNTAAASIPMALASAAGEGRIHDGDLVLLAAAGAGYTWGTALVRWSRREAS